VDDPKVQLPLWTKNGFFIPGYLLKTPKTFHLVLEVTQAKGFPMGRSVLGPGTQDFPFVPGGQGAPSGFDQGF